MLFPQMSNSARLSATGEGLPFLIKSSTRHNRNQPHLIRIFQYSIIGDEFAVDRNQNRFGIDVDFFERIPRGHAAFHVPLFFARLDFHGGIVHQSKVSVNKTAVRPNCHCEE